MCTTDRQVFLLRFIYSSDIGEKGRVSKELIHQLLVCYCEASLHILDDVRYALQCFRV